MSECVFEGLLGTVGTSSIVNMGRDIMDIIVKFYNQLNKSYVCIDGGSYREGFRMDVSDRDFMVWLKHQRVIWNLSEAQNYKSFKFTLILADCSDSPPGFSLLQLLTQRTGGTDGMLHKSCFRMNDKIYISSSLYIEMKRPIVGIVSKVNGPCVSGPCGEIEYDAAHSFVSDFWPPVAYSWIKRCQVWPLSNIVNDIVEDGCHFVTIGHKQGNHRDNEWRISFSVAEQRLVRSMDHNQFLIYGLLKLFMREVINNTSDENKLLSSYHFYLSIRNNA
ncbi:uncharacterized protein LOC134254859 [Saccostrea cucullata]|uniref:uncharacterized protein LOC134254859 n=1 Tax=Saccostrea cuccullata TaxID=36930 RepID=UPI002ED1E68C